MSTRDQVVVRSKTPYYKRAFGEEFRAIWGATPFKNEEDILSLCYFRAITCFLGTDADDENDRRELLYWFLSGESNIYDENSYINKKFATLPISDNLFKKISRNVLSAYSEPPARTFSVNETDNTKFLEYYKNSGANAGLKKAYKIAGFTNIVAIRPKRIFKKSLGRFIIEHEVLSPDMFRLEFADEDIFDVESITIPFMAGSAVQHRIWTAEYETVKDHKGKIISQDENRYGRIPYDFIKFSDGRDFYGGGDITLVQAQLYNNKLLIHADESETYSALSIWIGTNLDADGTAFKMSPGSMLNFKEVRAPGDGMDAMPDLEPKNGTPFFDEINNFRNSLAQEELRTRGLPYDAIADNPGTPLSGIARIIAQQELTEERGEHIERLRQIERSYAELFARIINIDAANNLPEVLDGFQIDFAEARYFLELKDDYEFDTTKLATGLLTPAEFVKKWTGRDGELSNDEAVKILMENKAYFKNLESGAATPVEPNTPSQTGI